jgi:hypothetical protein
MVTGTHLGGFSIFPGKQLLRQIIPPFFSVLKLAPMTILSSPQVVQFDLTVMEDV